MADWVKIAEQDEMDAKIRSFQVLIHCTFDVVIYLESLRDFVNF